MSRRYKLVIAYDGTDVDGPYNIQSYTTGSAGWDAALNGVVATGAAAFGGPKQREAYVFLAADTPCTGFDTRKNAFIGVWDGERRIARFRREHMAPGEMEQIILVKSKVEEILKTSEVSEHEVDIRVED